MSAMSTLSVILRRKRPLVLSVSTLARRCRTEHRSDGVERRQSDLGLWVFIEGASSLYRVGEQSEAWQDESLETLAEEECLHLLGTVPVGRVAVSVNALPAVFPVNFVLFGRRVVFRTGKGTKLDAAVRRAVVAFEVDHFDAVYHSGWSVLVVGQADDITDNLEMIGGDGQLRPWADGERDHYVAIQANIVSGRRITHVGHRYDGW